MRIRGSDLRRIIKEEITRAALREEDAPAQPPSSDDFSGETIIRVKDGKVVTEPKDAATIEREKKIKAHLESLGLTDEQMKKTYDMLFGDTETTKSN